MNVFEGGTDLAINLVLKCDFATLPIKTVCNVALDIGDICPAIS